MEEINQVDMVTLLYGGGVEEVGAMGDWKG